MPTVSTEQLRSSVQERMKQGIQAQRRGVALHKVGRRQRFAVGTRRTCGPASLAALRPPPVRSHNASEEYENVFCPFAAPVSPLASSRKEKDSMRRSPPTSARRHAGPGSSTGLHLSEDSSEWLDFSNRQDNPLTAALQEKSGGELEYFPPARAEAALQPLFKSTQTMHMQLHQSQHQAERERHYQAAKSIFDPCQEAKSASSRRRRDGTTYADVAFGSIKGRSVDPLHWLNRPNTNASRVRPGFLPDSARSEGQSSLPQEVARRAKVKAMESTAEKLGFSRVGDESTITVDSKWLERSQSLDSPKYAAFADRWMRERDWQSQVADTMVGQGVLEQVDRPLLDISDNKAAGQAARKTNDQVLPHFERNWRDRSSDMPWCGYMTAMSQEMPLTSTAAFRPPSPLVAASLRREMETEDELRRVYRIRRARPRAISADRVPAAGVTPYTEVWDQDSWQWVEAGDRATHVSQPQRLLQAHVRVNGRHTGSSIDRVIETENFPDKDGHCQPLDLAQKKGNRREGPLPITEEPSKVNLYMHPTVLRFSNYPENRPPPGTVRSARGPRAGGMPSEEIPRPGMMRSLSVQAPRRQKDLQPSDRVADALLQPTADTYLASHHRRIADDPDFATLADATTRLRKAQSLETLSIRLARNHMASPGFQECLEWAE